MCSAPSRAPQRTRRTTRAAGCARGGRVPLDDDPGHQPRAGHAGRSRAPCRCPRRRSPPGWEPERTTAAFVRMLRGDLDMVRAALRDLDDQEFADDATVQLCVAFWAEIVAGLRSDEHCARFIGFLEAASGVNLLIGGMYLGPVDRLLASLTRGPRRTWSGRRTVRGGHRPAVGTREPIVGGTNATRLGVCLSRARRAGTMRDPAGGGDRHGQNARSGGQPPSPRRLAAQLAVGSDQRVRKNNMFGDTLGRRWPPEPPPRLRPLRRTLPPVAGQWLTTRRSSCVALASTT